MTHSLTPVALAGLLSLTISFPGLALATDRKPIIIVIPNTDKSAQSNVLERLQGLVLNRLAQQGYVIQASVPSNKEATSPGPVELHFSAAFRKIQGTYTTRAIIGITATLKDADSKRHLGHVEAPTGTPFRIAANCIGNCEDRLFFERARPLAINLVSHLNRDLSRWSKRARTAGAEKMTRSVTFRGIDAGMLPKIEQYLEFLPGVSGIRRNRKISDVIRFHYHQTGLPDVTERSLRKMLDHLQINARLRKVNGSFIITTVPGNRPTVYSRDW
jgi:hypothetical protein